MDSSGAGPLCCQCVSAAQLGLLTATVHCWQPFVSQPLSTLTAIMANVWCCVCCSVDAEREVDLLHIKLEVLGHSPCPRWHADHVAARLLCTYTGPGTWYVDNR